VFKNIAGTFLTKFSAAGISFLMLILTANLLGAEIRGSIALIILGVTLTSLISQIAGGPAMLYHIAKSGPGSIILFSYLWAVLSSFLVSFILCITKLIPSEFFMPILIISLLQSVGYIHGVILMAEEKIKAYNFITFFQALAQILSFLVLLVITGQKTLDIFLWSLYFSNSVFFLISLALTAGRIKLFDFLNLKENLSMMVKNGLYTQMASIMHLLSIRTGYYYLNKYEDTSAVGIFSTGVSLTESVLLFGSGIAMVLYARVSNSKDSAHSGEMTVMLSKISFLLAVPVLIVMTLIPEGFYSVIFGKDFSGLKMIIASLSPGIAALSFYMIYSHYFSGMGKFKFNTLASLISFIVTLAGFHFLLPIYGLQAAGWICSAAYVSAFLYYMIVFAKESGEGFKAMLPAPGDYPKYLKQLFNR
jgi:O-antigen/teichoic acid export membrane protein